MPIENVTWTLNIYKLNKTDNKPQFQPEITRYKFELIPEIKNKWNKSEP